MSIHLFSAGYQLLAFHLFWAAVFILIGFLRGGDFRRFPPVDRLWVPPVAAIVQASVLIIPDSFVTRILTVASYILVAWFVVSNWRFLGLRLLAVGLALNFLVMVANGGQMPVSVDASRAAGVNPASVKLLEDGQAPKHIALTPETRLGFLGDTIPAKYPMHKVISVGDVFILLGAFLLVQEGMNKRVILFGLGG